MDDNRSSFVHNVLNSWELQTLQDQDQDRISFVSDVDTGRLLSASENGGREPMEQAESANLRTVASSVTVIEPHTESDGGVHSGSSENQHSTISNRQPAKTSNNTIREKRVQRLMKTMKGHLTSVWSTEILALLAALGLLGAIFGILIHYDGIQQPQWPYSINLNTVVDLLVTVLRAMLMQIIASAIGQLKWSWYEAPRPLQHFQVLDEATRGLWGSIKLLISIPGLNWTSLGTVIMVASSLGLGASSQQSIRTVACNKLVPRLNASIPVAQNISTGYTGSGRESENSMDSGLQGAFVAGLAGLHSAISLAVNCPTGNCSFPELNGITHSTLAFESKCFDVSSSLLQRGNTSWAPESNYTRNSSYYYVNLGDEFGSMGEFGIEYSLDRGVGDAIGRWDPPLLFTPLYGLASFTTAVGYTYPNFNPLHEILPANESDIWFNSNPIILQFLVPGSSPCAGASASYQTNNDEYPLPAVNTSLCADLETSYPNVTSFPGPFTVTAAVCAVYPSLRYYWGNITNGQLEERLVGDPVPLAPLWEYSNFNASWFGFSDVCIANGTLYSRADLLASAAPEDLVTIPSGSMITSNESVTGPRSCLYNTPQQFDYILLESAFHTLNSSVEENEACTISTNYADIMCDDAWWSTTVYNQRNATLVSIQQFVEGITDTMSTYVRTVGADNDGNPAVFTGSVYRTEICTAFVWEWLLLPVVFTALTGVLLAAVMLEEWKTSILPLMLYGLKKNEDHPMAGTTNKDLLTTEAMEKLAKSFKVRFAFEDGEWGLHEAK